MASKQRSVRLPEDVWAWIASLPERYGTDDTEKLKSVLLRGKEMIISAGCSLKMHICNL